jgi:hypothetical protein
MTYTWPRVGEERTTSLKPSALKSLTEATETMGAEIDVESTSESTIVAMPTGDWDRLTLTREEDPKMT